MSATTAVLQALQRAGGNRRITSYDLAGLTTYPQPSVRRAVGSLRAAGHTIVQEGTGLDATYRLVVEEIDETANDNANGFNTESDAAL